MKIKLIALAVAALVSGGANATLSSSTTATTGGSIYANLFSAASSAAVTVDLGVNAASFFSLVAPAATGVDLVWNLYNSTFSDLSSTNTGLATGMKALNFGGIVQGDVAAYGSADSTLSVMGGKAVALLNASAPGSISYVSTSNTTPSGFNTTALSGFSNMNAYLNAVNTMTTSTTNTITGASAGAFAYNASTDASNTFYGNASDSLGYKSTAQLKTNASLTNAGFYKISNINNSGAAVPTVTAYAGTWSFDAASGNLAYLSVAAVPEADSLAMLLAGLGAVATIVRRRKFMAA